MQLLLILITIITGCFAVLYFFIFLFITIGWLKTKEQPHTTGNHIPVAVIVPARNEAGNISVCLQAILSQNYPEKLTQIIVVDDHSDDETASIVTDICKEHSNVLLIKAEKKGKKNAIAEAIQVSTSELIVTTDADCRMGPHWLENIISCYKRTDACMIAGPVMFENEKTFFEKLQSLEMMALMGSTAGALYFNKPILCNGANLAYPRSVFNDLNGFEGIDSIASGDDVLLMYKIQKKYKNGIVFLKNKEAIVYTKAKGDGAEFLAQRRRWASKGIGMMNPETKWVSVTVYLFSFFILLMSVISGFATLIAQVCLPFFQICLILVGIKCVIDFLLLFLAASFFRRRHFLYLFIPGQFMYLIYIVVVGMLGNKGRFEWKGRKF